MDNASKNAGDMIGRLTMQYNRGRQANITNELVDIITGASGTSTLIGRIYKKCLMYSSQLFKWCYATHRLEKTGLGLQNVIGTMSNRDIIALIKICVSF
jgi:hypothetical protein